MLGQVEQVLVAMLWIFLLICNASLFFSNGFPNYMAQVIIYVVISMVGRWDNLKEYLLCCQCWLSWTVVCYNLNRLYILMIQSDPSVDDILVGVKVFNYLNQCCLVSQQKRNNNHIWICCPWNYFLLLEYLNELIFLFIYIHFCYFICTTLLLVF